MNLPIGEILVEEHDEGWCLNHFRQSASRHAAGAHRQTADGAGVVLPEIKHSSCGQLGGDGADCCGIDIGCDVDGERRCKLHSPQSRQVRSTIRQSGGWSIDLHISVGVAWQTRSRLTQPLRFGNGGAGQEHRQDTPGKSNRTHIVLLMADSLRRVRGQKQCGGRLPIRVSSLEMRLRLPRVSRGSRSSASARHSINHRLSAQPLALATIHSGWYFDERENRSDTSRWSDADANSR